MYAAFELESEANFETIELPATDHQNVQNPKEISNVLLSSPVQEIHQMQNSRESSEQSLDITGGLSGKLDYLIQFHMILSNLRIMLSL